MIRFEKQMQVGASRETIWQVMMDVEKWPAWTSTITAMKQLTPGNVKAGTKLLIKQPALPRATWTVIDVTPLSGFSMIKKQPFLQIIAGHTLRPLDTGTMVILSLEFSGFFAKWVAKKYQVMMKSYLETEARGLKQFSEALERITIGRAS